jgi:hypothetical protein
MAEFFDVIVDSSDSESDVELFIEKLGGDLKPKRGSIDTKEVTRVVNPDLIIPADTTPNNYL